MRENIKMKYDFEENYEVTIENEDTKRRKLYNYKTLTRMKETNWQILYAYANTHYLKEKSCMVLFFLSCFVALLF